MTTIAWDGRYIAADTLASNGRGLRRIAHKIHVLKNGDVFAGCGDWCDTILVRDHLDAGTELPKLQDDAYGNQGLLWVKAENALYTVEGKQLIRFRVWETQYASGSGCDSARMAMVCGKSAVEAVALTSRFDAFTNDVVDAYDTQLSVMILDVEEK